ncbi:MAG: hypothetical protein H6924_00045 [Alphaproteobacteria bacterium]|nr:hypothetical protein [Alphaproteobacteria bacterium]
MKRLVLLLVCLCGLGTAAAAAQTASRYHLPSDFEGSVDQDGARQAVKRGDAAPFEDIFRKVRPQIKGEIVGQKLEQHLGVWVYEFRVIGPDGHMRYLHFRARTGQPYQVGPAS